ncbi:MAG: hypothetical protein V6Z82_03915 [Flavobacteriales bacterium]
MKNLVRLVMGLALLTACQKDEPYLSSALRFQMNVKRLPMVAQANGNPGIAMVNESTSEETEMGAQRPTQIEIAINKGDQKIVDTTLTCDATKLSQSLSLDPGTYFVTKFLAKNDANQTIYLVPKTGSKVEKYVSQALPLQFTVTTSNEKKQVNVDVLPYTDSGDDDLDILGQYGYSSLLFHVVPLSRFELAVFDDDTWDLIDSHLYLSSSWMKQEKSEDLKKVKKRVFFDYDLEAGTHGILFPETYGKFFIKITADGYESYSTNKKMEELKGFKGALNVWQVYLKKADSEPTNTRKSG